MRLLREEMATLRRELHTAVVLLRETVIAMQDERGGRDPKAFLLQ